MSSHAQLLTTLENRHNVLLQPDFLLRLLSDKKMAESANRDEQVYNAFLETDIVQSSIPVIPPNFGQLHDILFPASSKGIILQINDIIDIENSAQSLLNAITASNPVRQVYQQAPAESNAPVNFPRGTLKLAVTDGYREVTALEVKRITSLSMNVPIGAKILVKHCHVAHGTLMLEPGSCQLLGGHVPPLYRGNMRKELERRLRLRLGLTIDDQGVEENQLPLGHLEQNTAYRNESIDIEDDMDSILQDAFLDEVMDIGDFASQDAHEQERTPNVSGPEMQPHTGSGGERLGSPSFVQDLNIQQYSDYDYQYDLSAEIDYEDKENMPLEMNTPNMSQELNDMVLMDEGDANDDVIEVKVEKVKEEGSVVTSVAQLSRIWKSLNANEKEWQHMNTITVEVASIKPVRLYVSDGENGIHMVGCLIPEGRRNEMAERVPILFTTESLAQLYGPSFDELETAYSTNSKRHSGKYLNILAQKMRKPARVQLDIAHRREYKPDIGDVILIPSVLKYTPS